MVEQLTLKAPDIRYGDVVPVYETPAFPAVEEQQQHRKEREPNAPGKYACSCPRPIADVPVDRCDHDCNQVAAHMQPRVRDVAYARLSKEVGEAENGGNQGHDNTGSKKPQGHAGPNNC